MHTDETLSASCFLEDAQQILQLQMTPGQTNGASTVNWYHVARTMAYRAIAAHRKIKNKSGAESSIRCLTATSTVIM